MSYIGSTKIGKMFLGSTEIGKAYLGSNLVFQKGGAVSTVFPYIRNTPDAYIDTGITPDETTKIIVWARNFNPGGNSYTWLFGSRVANQDSMFGLNLMNGVNSGKVRACFGAVNTDLTNKWTLMSHYHKYELSANGFYVDGTLISSVTASTFSNNHNIFLFNCNNGGSVLTTSAPPTDICACKIYKNNVLVRDFTAVESPSVGLYDAVSDTVFTNAGSGSLTYGTFDKSAYTPLIYILTSGSSYFTTPAIGSYNLLTLVTFYPTSSNAAWFDVVGGRDSSKRYQIFTGNDSISNARLYGIIGSESAKTIYSTNTSGALKNKKITVFAYQGSFSGYIDHAQIGSTISYSVNTSYSTGVPIGIGATWRSDSQAFSNKFVGRIYHVRLGDYNFVPAKVGGVAGMYETYNDVFYPSTSGTAFTAGGTI